MNRMRDPDGRVVATLDDYGVVPGCKRAVDEYRAEHHITEPIVDIDGWGVYWRREP